MKGLLDKAFKQYQRTRRITHFFEVLKENPIFFQKTLKTTVILGIVQRAYIISSTITYYFCWLDFLIGRLVDWLIGRPPYKRVGKSTIKMSKDEYGRGVLHTPFQERSILEKHKDKLYFDSQICKEATFRIY